MLGVNVPEHWQGKKRMLSMPIIQGPLGQIYDFVSSWHKLGRIRLHIVSAVAFICPHDDERLDLTLSIASSWWAIYRFRSN